MSGTVPKPSIIEPVDASQMVQTAVGNIRRRIETLEATQQTQGATLASAAGSVSVSDFNKLKAQVAALSGQVAVFKIPVQINGASLGAEQILNFIAGTGISITGIDEVGNRLDIRIAIPQNFSQTIAEIGNAMDTIAAYKNLNPFAQPSTIWHPGRKPFFNQFNARTAQAFITSAPAVNSVLLLHLDGTNGSTTTTDVYGHTITFLGSATLSTTQAKFGPSSLTVPSIGANGISCSNATDLVVFGKNYTAEFFIFLAVAPGVASNIMTRHASSSFAGYNFYMDASSKLHALVSTTGSSWDYQSPASPALSTSAWHHVALVGQNNGANEKYTVYLDGVSWDSSNGAGGASDPYNDGGNLVFGDSSVQSNSLPCFLDEIRISPVARYTANFTPPSSPFTF